MRRWYAILVTLSAAAFASAAGGDKGDWPTFRGPDRSGVAHESGLLQEWPKGGPPLSWKAEKLGEGYGTVAVVGDRAYVVGFRGDDEVVIALDTSDGREAWTARVGRADRTDRAGARCTPTVDGDRLYALSVGGDLVCFAIKDGRERWRKNLQRDFHGQRGGWGYAESPLIDGDKVVCTPGGREATLLALNKNTGRVIWRAVVPPGGEQAEYASILPADFGGTRMYVQLMKHGLVAVAARTGKFLWKYDRCANGTANCSMAVYSPGYVFGASGYGTGGGLVRLSAAGGGVSAREVYFTKHMQNQHGGMVLLGGYLYGSNEGQLTCLEFKTGKVKWEERKPGKGCITAADGNLIYRNEGSGDVFLVKADPEGYEERGRFNVPRNGGQGGWAYPVVAHGRLYVRDWHTLYCYDVQGR